MINQNNVVSDQPIQQNDRQSRLIHSCSLVIIGFGIGWLAGLSVSPVVSTIITSIVGVTVTLISVLSGIKNRPAQSDEDTENHANPRWSVNPVPIALLIVGILIGSTLGIMVRTRNSLGATEPRRDVRAEIQRWTDVGLDPQEVARRLFDLEYPVNADASKSAGQASSGEQANFRQSVLFGDEYKECEDLVRRSPAQLPVLLRDSDNEIFNQLPDIIQDPETLEQMVELLCEQLGQ